MKLERLEVSALLGLQARNRELLFMSENIKLQLEELESESTEFFDAVETRLKLAPDTLKDFDVDTTTGELIPKEPVKKPTSLSNNPNNFTVVGSPSTGNLNNLPTVTSSLLGLKNVDTDK